MLFSCALLGSCSERQPTHALKSFLAGVASIPELDREALPYADFPEIPQPSELRLDIPSTDLDTLDILTLRGCDIQKTIGKYKSSIGQSASDSQRLLLGLEYLQFAPPCIELLRASGRHNLAATLDSLFTTIKHQLPGLIYNATLANTEFQVFCGRQNAQFGKPIQASGNVIPALERIHTHTQRWLDGDYRADNMHFEILLSEVPMASRTSALSKLENLLESVLPAVYTDWKTARDKHQLKPHICRTNPLDLATGIHYPPQKIGDTYATPFDFTPA